MVVINLTKFQEKNEADVLPIMRARIVLYKGREMIPIYRLLLKHDGRCPNCNRKLSATPKTIELQQIIE